MKLTTDEVLERIGSFGRYQIVLNIYFNIAYALWWAFPVMAMVFIASEPGWKCKNNSTCPFTDTISLGDDRYKHRCDIPRQDWDFADDFTSVVTEVSGIIVSWGVSRCIYILRCGVTKTHVIKTDRAVFNKVSKNQNQRYQSDWSKQRLISLPNEDSNWKLENWLKRGKTRMTTWRLF